MERKPKTTGKRASPAGKPRTSTTSRRKSSSRAVAPAATTSRDKARAKSPSRLIDERIRELGGWRGETLARVRALIRQADPEITEEWKWNNPVWSHDGIVCTGEAYANIVKLTFARGASIPDPARLFNSSLTGSTRRAIDIREGEKIDVRTFKALVKAAVARNLPSGKQMKASSSRARAVKLLSGGNPQIAKAEGDAPVQAYIAAMPAWKRDVGERLDALIARSVPGVRKAVKWNSPFYGIEGRGWFVSFHVFTRYVKVTFFRGSSLRPVPPGSGKDEDARWIDIHEGDLNESQIATWVKQAAALPGWDPGPTS